MHIYKRCTMRINWNLIIYESVVYASFLSFFYLCRPPDKLTVVVNAFMLNDRTAYREMALSPNNYILCDYIQSAVGKN